jgi:hypothetical protein
MVAVDLVGSQILVLFIMKGVLITKLGAGLEMGLR